MEEIITGLRFGEGPRWHQGSFWFSDMHGQKVFKVDLENPSQMETVLALSDDFPSGLGWLPNGDLLIVAMETRRLLKYDGSRLETFADLSRMAETDINDMIVASNGNAYIGNMGYKIQVHGSPRRSAETFLVTPDGKVSIAAEGLEAPNGHILTPNEDTLIVAESAASRLTAFDVDADTGALSNRRVFAELEPGLGDDGATLSAAPPDGICLDTEGAVWVAEPLGRRVLRVKEGGEIMESHHFADTIPFACVLGGTDRKTLLICTAKDFIRENLMKEYTGAIYAMSIKCPGVGKP